MKSKLTLLIVMAISAVVLFQGINLPFAGHHDWNSVMYANVAHNHLRYGLANTKLGMVTKFGYFPNESFGYFTHYPPLMPLLLAVSFSIFGVVEWAGRLVPILSSLVMIFFIFKLANKHWNLMTAFFASAFLTGSPMLVYFSKIPVHETVVLGFTGMAFWFYSEWLTHKNIKYFWLLTTSIILAQLTSWSGFYLAGLIPIHFFLFQRKKLRKFTKKIVFILFLGPVMFFLHIAHIGILSRREGLLSLFKGFLFRLNVSEESANYGFTYSKFLERQTTWILTYFTRAITILSIIWIAQFIFRRIKKKPLKLQESLLLLLLFFGFSHNLIFQNLAFIHDYMLIYALPFFAISAAVTLAKFIAWLRTKSKLVAILGALMIIVLTVTEKTEVIKGLFHSGDSNTAHPLGIAINRYTEPGEKVLILSPQFMVYHDVFLRYYADRTIAPAYDLASENIQEYRYVIIPLSHDFVSAEDKIFLNNNYRSTNNGSWITFDINQPK